MLDAIQDLLDKSMTVKFTYERSYVVCSVKRPYFKHLAVQTTARTDMDALKRARILLDKVEKYEQEHGHISGPPVDVQPNEGGYHHLQVLDTKIVLRRYGMSWEVTNFYRVDKNGFVHVDEPYPVSQVRGTCTKLNDLGDGTELWSYDNIGHLSGDAGQLVVRDGLVIKRKMTMMS